MRNLLVLLLISLTTLGCNVLSRKYGGDSTVNVGCGKKVINVTWKGSDFWVLTRPMRADETPEVYEFSEDSNLGILEGTVTVRECKR